MSHPAECSSEMGKLMATVSKWGLESGFLGIEDHLEPRLVASVQGAKGRLFGSSEAEVDRLRSELDAMETDWDQAAHLVSGYRARLAKKDPGAGWWTRLRCWFWDLREYRAARARCNRIEAPLRSKRLEFAAAERQQREAKHWCEVATQALLAQYEFEKARAACLRPEKEITHVTNELVIR